jgi:hypothetical protein
MTSRKDKRKCILTTQDGVSICLAVIPCSTTRQGKADYKRWLIYTARQGVGDFKMIARLTPDNGGLLDFFILPGRLIGAGLYTISTGLRTTAAQYQWPSLDVLLPVLSRRDLSDCCFNPPGMCDTTETENLLSDYVTVAAELLNDEDFRTLLVLEGITSAPAVFWNEAPGIGLEEFASAICEAYLCRIMENARLCQYIGRRHPALAFLRGFASRI